MDLDQIIHDADPAHGLAIDVPESTHPSTRSGHLRELAAAIMVVATCVAVTVLALQIHGDRGVSSATTPRTLPVSSSTLPAVGSEVLPRTAHIVVTRPDPDGGPAWGLRSLETRDGMTCLEAARTESGLLGGIGLDGAYHGDGRFHPFPVARFTGTGGIGDCEPNDAHGHAFMNVSAVNTAMTAAEQPCLEHDDARPREHCAASALRDVYFGLLGPDATSITYVGAGGRTLTVPTVGPDGAYLVVEPVASGSCGRSAMRSLGGPSSCDYDVQGDGLGANLRSGEITAVTYRGGRVCHLPAPHGVVVRVAHCPVVGYVAPAVPQYTQAEITAPVTVRKLPARYYCERPGRYRPAALAIPCDGAVPHGYQRFDFTVSQAGIPSTDPGQYLLIYVSWTARGAVRKTDQSSYSIAVDYPRGCNAGGQGTGTQAVIRAGQRVTRSLYVPTACRGTYRGEVTYIPNLGPDGANNVALGTLVSARGVLVVGRFSFEVP